MSSGQMAGYAVAQPRSLSPIKPARRVRRKEMKLTWKQRLRNWINDSEDNSEYINSPTLEADRLSTEGIRLQIYKASGGYVIETRYYDRRSDRHDNKMYVVNDDKDLGEELGKIITMESLR